MPQHEFVPNEYHETDASSTHISLSCKDSETDWTLTFEALRSNLFRTTFSSESHPLPPHPSAPKPEVKLDTVTCAVDVQEKSRTFYWDDVVANVSWDRVPVITVGYRDIPQPLHEDLDFRSYAVDGTGISHYTRYKRHTLHVGLGEKAAPMDLSNRHFIINATDSFGYDVYRTDPLYKHIPLLINATRAGCVGIFSTSHSRGTWSVGSEMDGLWGHYKVYRQDYGGLEEYIIIGRTLKDVVRTYAEIVGYPMLVPRWAYGYISGGMKYSMVDEPRAADAIVNFLKRLKEEDIPCSGFQMSSGYTVSETPPKTRNVFTWNRHRFPDPKSFTAQCHELGIRLLANVKPYVLANHPSYPELAQQGALFTDPRTRQTAITRLWSAGGGESGEGSHIDFTSTSGFNWWYNGTQALRNVGIDAIWNDNNEYTIPDDDWECALQSPELNQNAGTRSKKVGIWGRAVQCELMGKCSHDALVDLEDDVRPFVLTRSATPGTMRYACSTWSGDNVTSWDGMKGSTALSLNAGMSLLQSYGHDIGGFEGPQPTPELLLRWIQLGIYSPRFAINCFKTSPDNNTVGEVIEPFMYPEITSLVRKALKRRYELIPYLYSLGLEIHLFASPPQRWVGWGYESDEVVWGKECVKGERQYWLGDALLVGGVPQEGETEARMYLPKGPDDVEGSDGYINFNPPYDHFEAGQWVTIKSEWRTSIPVLAKVGTAIPTGKNVQTRSSREPEDVFASLPADDYRALEIYPPRGSSRARKYASTWYEDDGMSRKPDIAAFRVEYECTEDEVTVTFQEEQGNAYRPQWDRLTIVLPCGDERHVVLLGHGRLENVGKDESQRTLHRTGKLFS